MPDSARSAAGEGRAGVPPRTLLLIAAITLLWGLNWPAMKLAVGELSPWTFRAVCVVVSALGLMALAMIARERIVPPRRLWAPLAGVALLNVTGWHLLSAFGLLYIEGGRAAIVAYTMPVWAALLSALFLGERFDARRAAALFLGMAGVAFLIGPDLLGMSQSPLGPILMTGAAVSWAGGTVGIKAERWPIGVMAFSGWQLLIGGVPILLACLLLEPVPDLSRLTWRGALATAYASTVALIFCFAAYNKVVTMLSATAAAISTLATPVVGLLSAAWLLGEPAGWRELLALGFVLSAMALVLVPRRRAAAPEPKGAEA